MIQPGSVAPSSFLHDHAFYSHFYGEPFSDGRTLYFFDGWTLRVCGYALDGGLLESGEFSHLVEETLPAWQFRTVELESPAPLKLGRSLRAELPHRVALSTRSVGDHEFVVSRSSLKAPRIRDAHQRGRASGIEVRRVSGPTLDHRLIRLLWDHCWSFDSSAFYRAEYAAALSWALDRPDSIALVAFRGNVPCGFGLGRVLGAFGAIGAMFRDPAIGRVSDALYAALLDALFSRDVRAVSLGFGISDGLRAYKGKWGAAPAAPASCETRWSRRRRVYSDYLWMTALARSR